MKSNVFSQDLKNTSKEDNNSLIDFNPDFKIKEADNNITNNFIDFDPDERIERATLNECLLLFEQSNWDCLDAFEIDEAILNLKDAIALDLGLKNIPDIGYYFENNEFDYGAFSVNDNKIYLNCYHLEFPERIAKILAHELRHCWQTEQINLPEDLQTEFSKVLKFNNENYVDPYDNYCAYWHQPMEVDARLYSDEIMSNVFEE